MTGVRTAPQLHASPDHRRTAVLLGVIIVAAALIRIPFLHDGLWRDDAYAYLTVTAPTLREMMHRVAESEYHPPLFFLINYVWVRLAGTSEVALKFLPFTFGLLTVPAVYRLGRLASSTSAGLLAAAMFALSPVPVTYSSEYLYPLIGLLCTVLTALVMPARRESVTTLQFVVIALVTSAALYTHYVALMYVPLVALWALTSPRGLRHGLLLASALVFGSLPFIFWLPTWLSGWPVPFVQRVPASVKPSLFLSAVLHAMPAWSAPSAALLLVVGLVALFVAIRGRLLTADAGATAVLFGAITVALVGLNLTPLRYLSPFVGLLCVALASALVGMRNKMKVDDPRAWSRWGRPVVVIFLAVYAVMDVAHAASVSALAKSGIRSFVAAQPLDPATLYVIAPDYMASTFAFYSRNQHIIYTAFVHRAHPQIIVVANYAAGWLARGAAADGAAAIAKELQGFEHVDLIVDEDIYGPSPIPYQRSVSALIGLLGARYPLLSVTHYGARYEPITVYRFSVGREAVRGPQTRQRPRR